MRRLAKRVLLIRNLPFELNNRASVESAVISALVTYRLPVRVSGVELQCRRSSGRFNGAAWVSLAEERQIDATLRTIRKGGLVVGDRKVRGSVVLRIVDEGENAGCALDIIGGYFGSRPLPTVDELRELLLRNDAHDVLRRAMLPGLLLPESVAETRDEEPTDHSTTCAELPASAPMGRFAETIVRVDRVQKAVKGGVITRFRALVVVGNLMGAGGFAFGKAATPAEAVARASKAAKRDLRFFDRFLDTALAHDVRGTHNNCTVDVLATPPTSGPKGGRLGRAILTQLGFSNFTIKVHGRRTPASYVYATFNALGHLQSVEDIARKYGRRLLEIEHSLLADFKQPRHRPAAPKFRNLTALQAYCEAATIIDYEK